MFANPRPTRGSDEGYSSSENNPSTPPRARADLTTQSIFDCLPNNVLDFGTPEVKDARVAKIETRATQLTSNKFLVPAVPKRRFPVRPRPSPKEIMERMRSPVSMQQSPERTSATPSEQSQPGSRPNHQHQPTPRFQHKTEIFSSICNNVFHGNNKLVIHHQDGLQLNTLRRLSNSRCSLLPRKPKYLFIHDDYKIAEYNFKTTCHFIKDLSKLPNHELKKVIKRVLYGLYEVHRSGVTLRNFSFVVDSVSLRPYLANFEVAFTGADLSLGPELTAAQLSDNDLMLQGFYDYISDYRYKMDQKFVNLGNGFIKVSENDSCFL